MTTHTVRRDNQIAAFLRRLDEVADVTPAGQVAKLGEEVQEVYAESLDYLASDRPGNPAAIIGELADVIIVCHTIAALLDVGTIQLMQTVDQKIDINIARDWARDGSGGFHHTEDAA